MLPAIFQLPLPPVQNKSLETWNTGRRTRNNRKKEEKEEVLDTFLKFIKALRWKRKKIFRFFFCCLLVEKEWNFPNKQNNKKVKSFFCVLIAIKSNVINHSFWCLCLSIESIKTRPRSINHNIYIYVGNKKHFNIILCFFLQ